MDSLSAANGTFAMELFKKLTESNKKGNLFYSPFSISCALGMVYQGAKENTAAQMSKVLQFEKVKNLNTDFQSLMSEINKPDKHYLLKTANRLYAEKTFTLVKEFLESLQKYFYADLQSVDFSKNAEDCRKEINSWVEQTTEGKIKDLLPDGSVDALTRLVLVNAIYFKGNWAEQFDKAHTHEMPFRMTKNETKPVQMMYKTGKYPMTYVKESGIKVLELPYLDNEMCMIIMLPDDIEGLEKVQKALTYSKFSEWTDSERMASTKVDVYLPKFKLENSYDLNSVLSDMGMPDAFDQGKCDFSGMSCNTGLFLSKVVHKAFVEVNEEGTEAAAATAGTVTVTSIQIVPKFVCDHPFLFFLTDKRSGSILFVGRFCTP